jgi:hypothetical protein
VCASGEKWTQLEIWQLKKKFWGTATPPQLFSGGIFFTHTQIFKVLTNYYFYYFTLGTMNQEEAYHAKASMNARMTPSLHKWCDDMLKDKEAMEEAFKKDDIVSDGDETEVIEDDMIDKLTVDDMTVNLEDQDDTFSLSEEDYYALNVPPLNINNDDDAKRWEELMKEEAETDEVIIPKKTLSQERWKDQGDEGLFSDDEKDEDINPLTGRKRVKIVDSDDEEELVQLAPIKAIDLTKDKKKAEQMLLDYTDESKDKKRERQVIRWCFTMNNPTMDGTELERILKADDKIKGFVFQLEEGDNGTPHFQGYLEFKKAQKMSAMKTVFPQNVHASAANGDKESNLKYCTKEEGRKEGPWIWGTCTDKKGQGKRSDLNDFARAVIQAGDITEEIEEMYPGHAMQYRKHAKAIASDHAMRDAKKKEMEYWMQMVAAEEAGEEFTGQQQMNCKLFFGPTAVGKTTMVKKMTLGKGLALYTKAGWNKWFEGYEGEEHMLVDEFTTGFCNNEIENFNTMTNIGVNVQEVKGSHVLVHVTHAYFTTNKHPLDIWDTSKNKGSYKAFTRRFAEVYWWNDKHKLVVLKNPGPKEDADNLDEWKEECKKWLSFWNGQPIEEGLTIVPGEDVKNYFTFGCNK